MCCELENAFAASWYVSVWKLFGSCQKIIKTARRIVLQQSDAICAYSHVPNNSLVHNKWLSLGFLKKYKRPGQKWFTISVLDLYVLEILLNKIAKSM